MNRDESLRVKALVKKNELEKALRAIQDKVESNRRFYFEAPSYAVELAGEIDNTTLKEKAEETQAQIKLLEKFLSKKIDLAKEFEYVRNIETVDAKMAGLRLEERENREPLGEIHQLKALLGA